MANVGLLNKNAGNLKDPATGNFRKFTDPNAGYQALISDLEYKKSGQSPHIKPGGSILDLANVWAPASDNNKPADWANNVAKTVGTDINSSWSNIPTDALAKGIQVAEGTNSMKQPQNQSLAVAGSPNLGLPTLAQKVKSKYPQYADIPDDQLTQKILQKYPQYSDIAGGSASPTQNNGLGAFNDTSQPTAKQQADVNQNIQNPAEKPKSKGLLGTIGSGIASVAKGIISPVATLAARPIQAVAESLGASAEDVNKVTKDLAGDVVAPVPQNFGDVKKDVGRGAETVALGLAPVAGGATFGVGSSLEKGNDLFSGTTALNAGAGLIGGKIADVASPYIAKGVGALIPKGIKDAISEGITPVEKGVGDFMDRTKILPDSLSKAVNTGAEAVNNLPGKIADTIKGQYGFTPTSAIDEKALRQKAQTELSQALGDTGKKSVGVQVKGNEINNPKGRLAGLENLADSAPTIKVTDDLGNSVPYDPTTATASQHAQALYQAKQQTYTELEQNLTGATKSGVEVDTKDTIQHLQDISKDVSRSGAARFRAKELIKEISPLKTPTQVNNYLQDLNTGLGGVASGSSQNIGRKIELEATQHLNDALDKTVLNTTDNSLPIRQLKDKYSSYKAIENDMVKLAQKMARKTSGGLGGGISDYINAFNLADALELFSSPLGVVKAGARAGILKGLSKNKDPEVILQNVFKTIEMYKNLEKGIKPVVNNVGSNIAKNTLNAGLIKTIGVGQGDTK